MYLIRDINEISYKHGELNDEVVFLREKCGSGMPLGPSDAEADQSEGSPVYKKPLARANQEKALMQVLGARKM